MPRLSNSDLRPGTMATARGSNKTEIRIGSIVRRLRIRQQLSVRSLADKCGFSPSFISQIELGQASPSIASTERITSALGVTLGEFFRSAAPATPAVTMSRKRPVLQSQWSRARIEPLGPANEDSRLEAVLITLEPGGASAAHPCARETEQLAVIFRGMVRLQLEDEPHILKEGDSASIPSGTRHFWKNTARRRCQILLVSPR
ncbi:MAG TPA: XRE family transcriptional regulator [Nitrospiraceae bacterium]|nr:XRE family transcriptional regulator [Nitrospiraceae bacterium]